METALGKRTLDEANSDAGDVLSSPQAAALPDTNDRQVLAEEKREPGTTCDDTCVCRAPLMWDAYFLLEYQDRFSGAFCTWGFGPGPRRLMKVMESDNWEITRSVVPCSNACNDKPWLKGPAVVDGRWWLVVEGDSYHACVHNFNYFFKSHPEFKVSSLQTQHLHSWRPIGEHRIYSRCVLATPVCLDHLKHQGYAPTRAESWSAIQPSLAVDETGQCIQCKAAIAMYHPDR
jgi:hypothetical protein